MESGLSKKQPNEFARHMAERIVNEAQVTLDPQRVRELKEKVAATFQEIHDFAHEAAKRDAMALVESRLKKLEDSVPTRLASTSLGLPCPTCRQYSDERTPCACRMA